MAFTSLDGLRTGRLNPALGLSSDADDDPFGDATTRNNAIKVALAQLWPAMARIQRETVTIVANQFDYTLTSLEDVTAIEVVDGTSSDVVGKVPGWRLYHDEAAEPRVVRIRFEAIPSVTSTLRAIGYAPYKSEFATGATLSDLPPELEWIPTLGAQAELYRRKLNQRMNFQQHAVANRDTDTSITEFIAAYQLVRREFLDAISQHPRQFIASKSDRTGRR